MLGREQLFEGESDLVPVHTGSLGRCPHCQESGIRLPDGLQGPLVGRACLLQGPPAELRKLELQTPWTCEEESSLGLEALEAWCLEKNTPALDRDLHLSPEETTLLRTVVDKVPPTDTPFDAHTWDLIAQLGDNLIRHMQSVTRASQAYIQEWGEFETLPR